MVFRLPGFAVWGWPAQGCRGSVTSHTLTSTAARVFVSLMSMGSISSLGGFCPCREPGALPGFCAPAQAPGLRWRGQCCNPNTVQQSPAHGPWRQRPGLDSDSAAAGLCSHESVFSTSSGFVLCHMEVVTALVSHSVSGDEVTS